MRRGGARGGWTRWAALGALVLVAAGGATTLVLLRVRTVLEGRSDELVAAVGHAAGLPIAADGVSVSWWPPGVTAHGVEIPDRSPYGPGDLARIDEARLQVALLPLLRGLVVVTEVRLVSPVVYVVRGVDGGWNVGATPVREELEPARDARVSRPAAEVVIDSIRVRNARLVYSDRAIPGLGELEVKAGNALLRRRDDAYRIDFNAQALGGPEENVQGFMVVPRGAPSDARARLEVQARSLAGERLPEVIALLRGEVPFGIELAGDVRAQVVAEMPVAWPPTQASGRLGLDAGEASLRAADGWVVKQPGTPFDVDLELRAGDFGLAVDGASVASEDVRLTATRPDPQPVPAGAGQQPLVLALEGLDASRLAAWMPSLAVADLRGPLTLEGRITPGLDGVATDLRVVAGRLHLGDQTERVSLGGASLDLALSHGGSGVLGTLRVSELASRDGTLGSAVAEIAGQLERPLDLRVSGARVGRNGAALDAVAVEAVVGKERTQIRNLHVAGLGGTLAAHGELSRSDDGTLTVALEPEWNGVQLAGLMRFLGEDDAASGTFAGRARLVTAGADLASSVANLAGSFEASLGDGSLPGLNVARATLDNLDAVPRLKEAVDRRARERVPELLAPTSEIVSLRVEGTVEQGRILIADLRLESRDYTIDARGRLALDGEADLKGHLVLSEDASRSLVSGAGVLEVLARSGEQIRIPISVRGSYPSLRSRPSNDYVAEATARAVKLPGGGGAASFLRRLLGEQ
ncbi:MAG: AsmA-like C-terminal region-containing protein [Thermodesulfobacteriota bacterium]